MDFGLIMFNQVVHCVTSSIKLKIKSKLIRIDMENPLIKKEQKQSNSLIATDKLIAEIMPLMNLPEQHHKQAFMQAIERFKITEQELGDGFWKAYADHYTPSTG